jgi:hypothetical protein
MWRYSRGIAYAAQRNYYPVRQTLGAALLQAGRLAEAEDQFQRALKRASREWVVLLWAPSKSIRHVAMPRLRPRPRLSWQRPGSGIANY